MASVITKFKKRVEFIDELLPASKPIATESLTTIVQAGIAVAVIAVVAFLRIASLSIAARIGCAEPLVAHEFAAAFIIEFAFRSQGPIVTGTRAIASP